METVPVLEPLPAENTPTSSFPLSTPARGLLAILSISCAIIHLVMVPPHISESVPLGLGFAFSGWFQLGFGILVVAKPSKRLLQVGILANIVFIGVWALSRTKGLPFGLEGGVPEAATFIDITCAALEGALVVACAAFAKKPRLGENFETGALVAASIVPLGVVMLTTAVLASPSASSHDHGHDASNVAAGSPAGSATMDHGAMDHANGAMDHTNMDHAAPGAMDHSNGAMDHSAAGAMDHANGAMDHGNSTATPTGARCDYEFNTTAYWAQNPPLPVAGQGVMHHHDGAAPADGTASAPTVGNKMGVEPWQPLTNPADCAKEKADLATMAAFAAKYPTAQDAVNAGCVRVTIYVPGIAAHYACFKEWDDKLDVNHPEMILYGGSQLWAPFVGLSYYNYGPVAGSEWQFGEMPFHVHDGLCVKGTLVIGGDGSDKAKCEAEGGKVMGQTGNMGHYWLPSCSSPDGVFSADNPRLDMGVANLNDDPKYDPSKGGDPTVLQKNPCAGSAMQDQPAFGPPAAGTGDNAAAPAK